MKLKSLEIKLNPSWSDNAGKYAGEIEYESPKGSVKMILSPEVSNALLVCIGNTITGFAAAAAQEVRDNIITSVEEAQKPMLEAKTSEV